MEMRFVIARGVITNLMLYSHQVTQNRPAYILTLARLLFTTHS